MFILLLRVIAGPEVHRPLIAPRLEIPAEISDLLTWQKKIIKKKRSGAAVPGRSQAALSRS